MTTTADPDVDGGLTSLLRRPGYRRVVVGSLLWHTNRWGAMFTAVLWLTRLGSSPLRIQVIGALFFAPMLLGAAAATGLAAVAPRTVVLVTQVLLLPVQAAMFALAELRQVGTWAAAVFMLLVGLGNTVNMTSQRLMIQDAAGRRHAAAALKLEPVLSGIGSMVGAFGAGVLVDRYGAGAAFGVVAALDAACIVLTLRTAAPDLQGGTVRDRGGASGTLAVIRASPGLAAMIAVTLVMNLLVFGYISLIPKISSHYTASAAVAGLLAATAGLGQLVGGLVIAAAPDRRRGLVLFAGSALAALGAMTFAVAPSPAPALAALFVAGLGQSGFSAMQSIIAMELPRGRERTAALGAVSTAVGAMPLGMVLIGLLSQDLGDRGGVLVSSGAGLALLLGAAVASRRSAPQWVRR